MDVVLLGAAAIVLIALTLWVVWRPAGADEGEPLHVIPDNPEADDLFTSATADLSAGGVAVTTSALESVPRAPSDYQATGEPWSEPGLAREGIAASVTTEEPSERRSKPGMNLGIGAALVLGGAAAGAWLYSRFERERNKPKNRLRRKFR